MNIFPLHKIVVRHIRKWLKCLIHKICYSNFHYSQQQLSTVELSSLLCNNSTTTELSMQMNKMGIKNYISCFIVDWKKTSLKNWYLQVDNSTHVSSWPKQEYIKFSKVDVMKRYGFSLFRSYISSLVGWIDADLLDKAVGNLRYLNSLALHFRYYDYGLVWSIQFEHKSFAKLHLTLRLQDNYFSVIQFPSE